MGTKMTTLLKSKLACNCNNQDNKCKSKCISNCCVSKNEIIVTPVLRNRSLTDLDKDAKDLAIKLADKLC